MKYIVFLLLSLFQMLFSEIELVQRNGYISRAVEIKKMNHVQYNSLMVFYNGTNYNWFDEYFILGKKHYFLKNTVFGVKSNYYYHSNIIMTYEEYSAIKSQRGKQ